MNENIKFVKDSERGKYAIDDTGVLIAVTRDYTNRVVGIVRLDDGSYVEALLGDFEYVASDNAEE